MERKERTCLHCWGLTRVETHWLRYWITSKTCVLWLTPLRVWMCSSQSTLTCQITTSIELNSLRYRDLPRSEASLRSKILTSWKHRVCWRDLLRIWTWKRRMSSRYLTHSYSMKRNLCTWSMTSSKRKMSSLIRSKMSWCLIWTSLLRAAHPKMKIIMGIQRMGMTLLMKEITREVPINRAMQQATALENTLTQDQIRIINCSNSNISILIQQQMIWVTRQDKTIAPTCQASSCKCLLRTEKQTLLVVSTPRQWTLLDRAIQELIQAERVWWIWI